MLVRQRPLWGDGKGLPHAGRRCQSETDHHPAHVVHGTDRHALKTSGSSHPAGQRVRQRPRPAGDAARRAERPTRVTGTTRPDPGSRWSPAAADQPPGRPSWRRRRPRRYDLDAGVCRAGWYFPPGEGIGRTRPGAGSRPRRGRFRPSDHRRHRQFLALIEPVLPTAVGQFLTPQQLPGRVPPGVP
jgi:hypothetical protein